jgi:N-acetylneuraminic acid mutarotase
VGIREKLAKWCPKPEQPALTNLRHYSKPIAVLTAAILTISVLTAVSWVMTRPSVPLIPLATPNPTLTPTTSPSASLTPAPTPTASPSPSVQASPSPTNSPWQATYTPFSVPTPSPSPMPTIGPPIIASPGNWSSMTPMPTARMAFGVAVVNGKIYAIGGTEYGTNEMYDPATNTWTTMVPMPTPRSYFAAATYNGKIYCIGGVTSSIHVFGTTSGANEVYDPQTNSWETKAPLPGPRERMATNTVDGKIYLIGGGTVQGPFEVTGPSTTDIYDPATDTWSTGATSPYSVFNLATASVDSKIFIIDQQANRVYDTKNNTWSSAKPVPLKLWDIYPVGAATSGTYAPKLVYVLGGEIIKGVTLPTGANSNQIYNPYEDTWINGTSMPTGRWGFGIAVVNDLLYVIGGTKGYQDNPNGPDYLLLTGANEQYTPIDYTGPIP